MKKFKISILVILLNVLMIKSIEACDLLSVNIGGDKSTLNFIEIEDEDIDLDSSVTVLPALPPPPQSARPAAAGRALG